MSATRLRIIGREKLFSSKNQFNFNSLLSFTNAALEHKYGGEGGIRTPDTLMRCTPLAGERLRPLGHLSATRGASYPSLPRLQSQKLIKISGLVLRLSLSGFFGRFPHGARQPPWGH